MQEKPTTNLSFDNLIPDHLHTTTRGKEFILYKYNLDNSKLFYIIGTHENIIHLKTRRFGDGTFYVCPK
jgi:hypothetical protein